MLLSTGSDWALDRISHDQSFPYAETDGMARVMMTWLTAPRSLLLVYASPPPLSLPFLDRPNLDIIAHRSRSPASRIGSNSSNLLLIHYLENNATRNTLDNISRHSIPLKNHS